MQCPYCNKPFEYEYWCYHKIGKYVVWYGQHGGMFIKPMNYTTADEPMNYTAPDDYSKFKKWIVFKDESDIEKLLVLV